MRNRLKQKQKRKKPSSADIYIQQMTHVNELVVQLLQYARPHTVWADAAIRPAHFGPFR